MCECESVCVNGGVCGYISLFVCKSECVEVILCARVCVCVHAHERKRE